MSKDVAHSSVVYLYDCNKSSSMTSMAGIPGCSEQ